jgi:DNA-binding SARP family transcriptional activator
MPSAASAPTELRLYQQPRLLRAGVAVHVGARKALALLSLLALESAMPRDRLAALLWPEVDGAAARRNLRRELFRLRELGCAVSEVDDGALTLGATWRVDVRRFHAALQAGDDGGALELGGHRVFEGLDGVAGSEFDAWLTRWRALLREQRHSARQRRAAALEASGELAAALALHQQALAEDGCDEPAARAAMGLHAALGDRVSALSVFTHIKKVLHDELDLPPDAQTQALAGELRGPDALVPQLQPPTPPAHAPTPPRNAAQPLSAALRADRLPFVGRAAISGKIDEAWAAGRRVYLSGAAGAGKTRLAAHCLARQGAWLRIACAQDDAEQHYASAVRALRALHEAAPDVVLPGWVRRELAALLPELGPAPASLSSPEAAERLRAAFAAAWRLLVHENFSALLLDDWQWADAASVELWMRLDDDQAPVRWIVAYRSALLPQAALQRLRHDVDGGHAVALELSGLDAEETLALVHALSGSPGGRLFSQRLQRATDGNPFFLIETLRHLFEQGQLRAEADGGWSTPFDEQTQDYAELPVPASVREAVLGRVRGLGDAARRLLEAASLAGDVFDPGLLEGVTPLAADTMVTTFEHAHAARLLAPHKDGYRFAHDLVRQCLADSLSPARRRLLHQALAARLAQRHAPPALVAQHHERAGQMGPAIAWRLRAAEAAWRVHALADCRHQYEQALADGAAGPQAVAIHLALLRLHQRLADSAGVAAALAAALSASLDTDLATRLEVRLVCAETQMHGDRVDEALALLDAMDAELASAPPRQRARATLLRARVAQWRGHREESAALRQRAIALLEGQPDALNELADVFDDAARPSARGGAMPQAEGFARRAMAAYEAAGNVPALSAAATLLGVAILYGRGDRAASEQCLEHARSLAAQCGHVPAQRAANLNLVKLHTDAGRADAAAALIEEGDALAPGFEHQRAEQAFAQARYFVHYLRGETAAAEAAAQRLLAVARRVGERSILIESLQMVVDLYLHTGQLDDAARLLDEAEATLAETDDGDHFQQATISAKRAWWLLAGGDFLAAQRRLSTLGAPDREEDRYVIGWIGAAAALAAGEPGLASRCLQDLDIDADTATDALAMLLVQRLRLESSDAPARARGIELLAAGCVPALEAAQLRSMLG